MNNTNLENKSLWAHRLPVKTKININKITVLGIVLYGCIAMDGNWIL